jgi:anthranilate synthase component 1
VKVKTYKDTQFYSHVIHLVSEVEADLNKSSDALQIFADTFPAGTLSGAPKYKAMQLIDSYENQNRGFYGGAIGVFGFDGSVNHAITIRSFLSKNNTLFFQAGAGVVVDSNEENELQEVNNKLGALKQALSLAENI